MLKINLITVLVFCSTSFLHAMDSVNTDVNSAFGVPMSEPWPEIQPFTPPDTGTELQEIFIYPSFEDLKPEIDTLPEAHYLNQQALWSKALVTAINNHGWRDEAGRALHALVALEDPADYQLLLHVALCNSNINPACRGTRQLLRSLLKLESDLLKRLRIANAIETNVEYNKADAAVKNLKAKLEMKSDYCKGVSSDLC